MTNGKKYSIIVGRTKHGSLVKRLRHQPLTLKTWVRFPYESPERHHPNGWCFVVLVARTRNLTQRLAQSATAHGFDALLRRFRVGSFTRRSKFPYKIPTARYRRDFYSRYAYTSKLEWNIRRVRGSHTTIRWYCGSAEKYEQSGKWVYYR